MLRHLATASLAVAALSGPVACASVRLHPPLVEIQDAHQGATLRITNTGDQAIRFQTRVFRWSQAGTQRRELTDDLIVVPAITEIRPGATQVFRIALRRPAPAPIDRAYRLLLENISPTLPIPGAAVLKLSHDLPVFISTPAAAVRSVGWSACDGPGAPASSGLTECVRLSNRGNKRVRFETMVMQIGDVRREVKALSMTNLLADAYLDVRLAEAIDLHSVRRLSLNGTDGERTDAAPEPAR